MLMRRLQPCPELVSVHIIFCNSKLEHTVGRDYDYPKDKLSDVEIRRRYLEEEKRLKHLSRRAQYEHSTRKM